MNQSTETVIADDDWMVECPCGGKEILLEFLVEDLYNDSRKPDTIDCPVCGRTMKPAIKFVGDDG